MADEEEVRLIYSAVNRYSAVTDDLVKQLETISKRAGAAQKEAQDLGRTMEQDLKRSAGTARDFGGEFCGALNQIKAGLALWGAGQLITKALDFGEAGAQIINLERSFEGLAQRGGQSAQQLLTEIQAASSGIMSEAEAMRQYSQAAVLLGPDLAPRFGEAVQMAMATAAAGMGPFQQQLDSLIRGVARAQPEILDNLGVVADWPQVYAAAAAGMGKTVNELTKLEKQTIMFNEAQRQLTEKLGDLGKAADSMAGKGIAQLQAATQDYINYLKTEAAPTIDEVAGAIADMLNARPGGSRYVDAILDDIDAIRAAQRKVQAPQTGIGLLDTWLGQFREGDLAMRRMGASANEQEAALAALARQVDVAAMSQEEFVRVQRAFAAQSQSVADGLGEQRLAFLHTRNEQEHMIHTAQRLMGGFDGIGSHAAAAAMGVDELTAAMQALSQASDISAAISAVDQARQEADARGRWRREVEQTRLFDPQMAEQLETAGWYSFIIDDQDEYNRQIVTGTTLATNYWDTHNKGAAAAAGGYSNLQSAMESYYSSWQSQANAMLAPTQSTDFAALEAELGMRQETFDENARRAMAVAQRGPEAERQWAEMLGLGSREEALQYVKDFYAGALPEEAYNWEAAIEQYRTQMEGMVGQQNLQAMFQEKLIGAGLGPDSAMVMEAFGVPFADAGTDSAVVFAENFEAEDWTGVGTTAAGGILTGLRTKLEKGDPRFHSILEAKVIAIIKAYFGAGGELP